MCHTLLSFINIKNLTGNSHHIPIPNGWKVHVNMVSDILLFDTLILRNVLYVSQFRSSLIFVQRLCADNNITLHFSHSHCFLQAPSIREPMVLGKLSYALYWTSQQSIETISPKPKALVTHANTKPDSPMLWPLRLGHTS